MIRPTTRPATVTANTAAVAVVVCLLATLALGAFLLALRATGPDVWPLWLGGVGLLGQGWHLYFQHLR